MQWILVILLLVSPLCRSAELTIQFADGSSQSLSLEQIETRFTPETFQTPLPWFSTPQTFTAVKLLDVLRYFHAENAKGVQLYALNDYSSEISIDDIKRYQPYLVYKMNNALMRIRDKGPYWLVYDLARYPKLNTEQYWQQMTWQIATLVIE